MYSIHGLLDHKCFIPYWFFSKSISDDKFFWINEAFTSQKLESIVICGYVGENETVVAKTFFNIASSFVTDIFSF